MMTTPSKDQKPNKVFKCDQKLQIISFKYQLVIIKWLFGYSEYIDVPVHGININNVLDIQILQSYLLHSIDLNIQESEISFLRKLEDPKNKSHCMLLGATTKTRNIN